MPVGPSEPPRRHVEGEREGSHECVTHTPAGASLGGGDATAYVHGAIGQDSCPTYPGFVSFRYTVLIASGREKVTCYDEEMGL